MDGQDADNSQQSTADMTAFVQNLLQQMQTRFQTMSESIITKNELEQSINELREEMGAAEPSASPSAAVPRPRAQETIEET